MELLPFFLILLTSVLFAAAFRKFHLPWVLALICTGIIVGPQGFAMVEKTPVLTFLSEIGLVFLMFMAGLETSFTAFKRLKSDIGWLSLLNGLLPFAAGFGIGTLFNFSLTASLLLGVIFISSSIAVIIPTLESYKISATKLGRSIMASTMLVDVASLIMLSVLLQTIDPITDLPLPSFYFIVTLIMIGFAFALPRVRALIPTRRDEQDLFQSEARLIFALMIGVVVTFELLGLHPIIAGFFAGLVLSDSIKSELLRDKLRTMSYGIFIPVFFILIGMETNIAVLTEGATTATLIVAVVGTSIATKFFSGWIGGRLIGFKNREASIIGLATVPQLSTTLAVVFAAEEMGLLPPELTTAMVILSIVTTLVAPLGLRLLLEQK